jgi:Tfp pilus assembly protein PilN
MTDTTMQLAQVPGAPRLPQVNLLPPDVRARRRAAFARWWLALAVLVVVLVTILAAVSASWDKKSAESELVGIQSTNDSLVQEQAKFAEAPKALQELKARESARTVAMSTEMLWSPYLAAISSATPLEASIDALAMSQDTVWTGSQNSAAGPLDTPGTVGLVSLNGRALTLAAVSDWQDALNALKGVVDVEVSSVEVSEDNATTYYVVTATFKMTPDAFANQFVTEQ